MDNDKMDLDAEILELCSKAHAHNMPRADILAAVARLYPAPVAPHRVLFLGTALLELSAALEERLRLASPYFRTLLAPGGFAEGDKIVVEIQAVPALADNAEHLHAFLDCLGGAERQWEVGQLCAFVEIALYVQLSELECFAAGQLKAQASAALQCPAFRRLPWSVAKDLLSLAGGPAAMLCAADAWAGDACLREDHVRELVQHVALHCRTTELSLSAVRDLATTTSALRLVDLSPFFKALEDQLIWLNEAFRTRHTCDTCGKSGTAFEMNKRECFERYHEGTHQSQAFKADWAGWSCCDKSRMKDRGCRKRYAGNKHNYPMPECPLLRDTLHLLGLK